MIVSMKKIYLVLQEKDTSVALESLRQLGIIHVEYEKTPEGPRISEIKEEVQILTKVIGVLSSEGARQSSEQLSFQDWKAKAAEILAAQAELHQLTEDIAKRQALISQWEPWGDFNPQEVVQLAMKGIDIKLAEISAKDLEKIPSKVIVQKISEDKSKIRCVFISREKMEWPFETLRSPSMGLKAMQEAQRVDQEKIKAAESKIRESLGYLNDFREILQQKQMDLEFQMVAAGMGEAEKLAYLKGYCPIDKCESLKKHAQKEQWGLLIEDPGLDDRVPTLLRNPKWIRLIESLYNMMNVIPGYRELDISPFFLIFFSIFFGMLVGDAGYGFIFFLTTLFVHRKFGKRMPDKTFLYLTYVLSTVTIIWGILTGTVFGTLLFKQIFKPILPWLTEMKNVQMLCFALGAVHLTISHLWRFLNKIPKPMGMLSEIGWITLLWVAFFLAKVLILGEPFSMTIVYIGLAAIMIIIVDIILQRQEVGVNLFLLFFNVIGVFTDVVSYIRLFAVGLATVAIADSFNQIALDIGFNNIPQAILASLVLIFVHLFLNLILAMLGVLVHGLRLNILEFSSHLNLEWRGIKYEPFRDLRVVKT